MKSWKKEEVLERINLQLIFVCNDLLQCRHERNGIAIIGIRKTMLEGFLFFPLKKQIYFWAPSESTNRISGPYSPAFQFLSYLKERLHMGCNQSAEDKDAMRQNRELERQMEQEHAAEASKIKLLLLGTSLFLYQFMRKGNNWTEEIEMGSWKGLFLLRFASFFHELLFFLLFPDFFTFFSSLFFPLFVPFPFRCWWIR